VNDGGYWCDSLLRQIVESLNVLIGCSQFCEGFGKVFTE